jgi:U3 small nucleolar RNA-associated protein 25
MCPLAFLSIFKLTPNRIRRRILKNNEKLANAPKDDATGSSQFLDQGFVRPSILIIAPFRSSAHQWVTAFLKQVPSHQVENRARFFADFSLPNGAEDKLLTAPAGTYPEDHVTNMSGNIDDHFRIGIKVTRKTIKLFSDFYSSDIILASPLGLRELIEKEK